MTQTDKKLKTNQIMNVKIGNGQITIGHKTEMGKLNDVFEIGNSYRIAEGKKPKTVESFLSLPNTWEFIQEVERQLNSNRRSDDLEIPTKDNGKKVSYGEAIKQFSVIKSQRGGKPENRGVWANLYILIKAGMYLSPKLEFEIIDVFLNSQILTHRDNGGDNFKKLNSAMLKYIPSPTGKNRQNFIDIAKLLRHKFEITTTKGYNDEEHNSDIQQKRDELEKKLIFALSSNLIFSFDQLFSVAENYQCG